MNKSLITLALFFTAPAVFAAPCFHQGAYKGMGVGIDQKGQRYGYSVESEISSQNQSSSKYEWDQNQSVRLDVAIKDGLVYVNGNAQSSGKADCEMTAVHLSMNDKNLKVNEEWTFLGNYLLRQGTKIANGKTVRYQELLVRQN